MAAIPRYPCTSYYLGLPAPANAPTVTVNKAKQDQEIEDIASEQPIKVTKTSHGLETGQRVYFHSIDSGAGMAAVLNGKIFSVTKVDASNFTLDETDGTGKSYDPDDNGNYNLVSREEYRLSTAYVYTYVTQWGEEGPPSDPSDVVTFAPAEGDTIGLSSLSTDPGENYNKTSMVKRIYRVSSAGGAGERDNYQLVAEIDLADTTDTDGKTADQLAEALSSLDYDAPPTDMFGLMAMPNGIMVGFSGRDLCFCVPYLPHAWPVAYRQVLDYDIVGGAVMGNSIVVVTTGHPYLVTGVAPPQMTIDKLEINQSCVSKRSIVDMGMGVIYASPDGLVLITQQQAVVLTNLREKPLIDPLEWRKTKAAGGYEPTTIHAYFYEGKYIANYGSGTPGSFILDPTGPSLVHLSGVSVGSCAHNDLEDDKLYIALNSVIYQFEGGTTKLTAAWKSKKFVAPYPLCLGVAKVMAKDYPAADDDDLEFKLYADGVLKHTKQVKNATPFRLPGSYLAREFEIQVSTKHEIVEIIVGETMQDMAEVR